MPISSSPDPLAGASGFDGRQLRDQLAACAYPGYVYGYPHKKAYRALESPRSLTEVWRGEDTRHLFAYVHVPFCNQRCSFCNLFTYVPGEPAPAAPYLEALTREMAAYAEALGGANFARLYIGGGTPTFLTSPELRTVIRHLRDTLHIDPARTQGCIEASPETLDAEKIDVLRQLGFARLSLGVQSFVEAELRHVNRRFDFAQNGRAVELVGRAGFAHFNIDLIYGLPGQTLATWQHSLTQAIDSPATSLFLYPLYVRPLTGLAVRQRTPLDTPPAPTTHQMAGMYDEALSRLTRAGFRQWTMRQFRRDGASTDDEYSCQHHGMVGLGAGARSYTRALHYSTPWRMVARNIRGVVDAYTARMRENVTTVSHGFALDLDEQRRRYVIQSLLYDGLDVAAFRRVYGTCPRERYAEVWEALRDEGCVNDDGVSLRLTPRGTRHADIVGQLFFSERVRRLAEEYEYDE